MNLRYQTGTATFIQLAVVMFLIVMSNLIGFLASCIGDSLNCVASAFVSIVIVIGAGMWFGFLSVLGYAAQDKRSQRLASLLIAAEIMTALGAFAILRLPGNWYTAASAVIVAASAIWVGILAYRLRQAKGGRIVQRPRNVRRPDDSNRSTQG